MPRLSAATARGVLAAALVAGLVPAAPSAQRAVHLTSPREQFGHDIGADYVLIDYTGYVDYLSTLDRESDRLTVVDIGKTAEGRTEYTAIITSPENHRRLSRLKDTNRRLALGEPSTDDEARTLIRDAKAVVWIDGGLHATEVLGAQQLIETIYRLASRTDPETLRILNDVVILCTLVNPDGMELVSDWYMREPDPRKRTTSGLPRLYQKYVGHDNNRDFYMMNQPESEHANRILYREWFPAIMYNHHQTGPPGAVLFAPPFRDPFNYHVDPLVVLGIDLVGAAMHTRLAAEGKPGAVMRAAAPYSTWFNGGIRTTAYFHNQIGILTEMIGSPTPTEIPFVPEMQLPRADVPNPVQPQAWRFRQSIEYSLTTNYAILDIASKRREDFLFNMYRMARNAIEKGRRDSWTMHPSRLAAVNAERERIGAPARGPAPMALYHEVLRDPAARDPRGYILPAEQPDFPTAVKFVNTLIKAGVAVERATSGFAVAGRAYAAGSFVVKTGQAFRAHVLDMFEPQDHPDDVPYPGASPRAPYDVAGYTLAYAMGVWFDRILDGFEGPFAHVADVVAPPLGVVRGGPGAVGYLLGRRVNDAFIAVNRLLQAGEDVRTTAADATMNGRTYPAGTFFVERGPTTLPALEAIAAEKGLSFEGVAERPSVGLSTVRPARIGLWDTYGGSMPSGWTRWLLEQFEFSFDVVFPKTLDAGNLGNRFDVLIFVDGAIPPNDGRPVNQPRPESIPQEFHDRLGIVSVAKTVPALRQFVEQGGTLVAIGSSTRVASHFGLPVRDALVERAGGDGRETALPTSKFYVPGSLLSARLDTTHPLAFGLDGQADVFFDRSPAVALLPEAGRAGVRPVAWFDTPRPLRSGWAWGQQYLDQAVAILDAPLGTGRVVLSGPEIVWRGQPHGTFKLLFNCLYLRGGD